MERVWNYSAERTSSIAQLKCGDFNSHQMAEEPFSSDGERKAAGLLLSPKAVELGRPVSMLARQLKWTRGRRNGADCAFAKLGDTDGDGTRPAPGDARAGVRALRPRIR